MLYFISGFLLVMAVDCKLAEAFPSVNRLLSRVLNWLLSRKCSWLVDLLFRALGDNNHSGLLDDTWLACLLRVAKFLYPLLFVQLIKKVDVHNENYPGNVTEPLSKQQE